MSGLHMQKIIWLLVITLSMMTSLLFSMTKNQYSNKASVGISVYKNQLEDGNAVYFTSDVFACKANDNKSDAAALQKAINQVARQPSKFGILFIPNGKYIIDKTIYVWKGVRLIGYGKSRPKFILPKGAEAFQTQKKSYMIHFVSDMPKNGDAIRDANPGTFYSALNNINIEIEKGNENAVAVRSHFAQHSFIANVDFHLQSGRAAIEEVGNITENCRFFGGQYGIIATKTSPSWPFMLRHSYFEGQKVSAIKTEEAGLTIDRCFFKNVPKGITVNKDRLEELFVGNTIFENIKTAAIVVSDETNARAQYNMKNIYLKDVPVLASFRKSKKKIKVNKQTYQVNDFCHGLHIEGPDFVEELKTSYDIENLDQLPTHLQQPEQQSPETDNWINIKTLGAVGDGKTDDTKALQQAIDTHETLYLPTGRYLVTNTLKLKKNTTIIGLNPITTQIRLKDKSKKFSGFGSPQAVICSPKNGNNILSGIGISTGAYNRRAVGVKWQSGERSMINDVKFLGGHGTYDTEGNYVKIYNKFRTGAPYLDRVWDSQYWSLWVTNGGGGTFKNIWTANTYASAGMCITNTQTPGRIYALSSEHHVRYELMAKNVENWKIHALQMEAESAESQDDACPISIENSKNISFRNTFLYRVIRTEKPYPYAIKSNGNNNIEFCGLHAYTPTKNNYNNILLMQSDNLEIRPHEIARLTITKQKDPLKNLKIAQPVVSGFDHIDGATADNVGNIYFLDARLKQVYKWNWKLKTLTHLLDIPVTPRALAFDQAGHLIITTAYENLVFSCDPDQGESDLKQLEMVTPENHDGTIALLPAHRWRDEMHDFIRINTYSVNNPPVTKSSYNMAYRVTANPLKEHFIAKDGKTFIPNGNDLIRAFSLKKAVPGKKFYMVDEFREKTYRFEVKNDGSLSAPEFFVDKGEVDVKADKEGIVYIPAGQIYMFDETGKKLGKIEVPERPSTVILGGENKETLYITAGTSLYKYDVKKY